MTDLGKLLPTRPRLLALGEPHHGDEALLAQRNDLFRHLVEKEGYRTVAIESDCLRGLIVDDYVTGGAGTLDDVMARGFSHEWFNHSAANRELVAWMRTINERRPASERVRFAGFDGPLETAAAESPRRSLTELHTFLAAHLAPDLLPGTAESLNDLLGPDDRWTDPAAMMNPARSIGRSPEAVQLHPVAGDLAALLEEHAPDLTGGLETARLHARTATGLLRYHFWMADTSAGRVARLLGVRATMMAANLLALADRSPTLAHANNVHLQLPKSTMQLSVGPVSWWSAGAIAATHLHTDFAFLTTTPEGITR